MGIWSTILNNLPEVAKPTQRRLAFKEKIKWTLLILVIYYVLSLFPLFGLGDNALEQFEFLSIILGAKFGSIISLGIGPIVTASIVLQLLNGSGIVKFDLTSSEGKKSFQGTQKMLSLFFIVFEAIIYVFMGGLAPGTHFDPATASFFIPAAGQLSATAFSLSPAFMLSLKTILVIQLVFGGLLILFMDEVVSKWGFGSGISLFIAAGVSQSVFIQAFNWFPGGKVIEGVAATGYSVGAVPALFQSLLTGDPTTALLKFTVLTSTILVFLMSVYAQAMKVEIPLSFGRIRGHGIRWPLSFIYTSNIPVILISALMANLQLWSRLLQNFAERSASKIIGFISIYIFGQTGTIASGHGILQWVNPPGGNEGLLGLIIRAKSFFIGSNYYTDALGYIVIMILGSVLFSIFWVQTAGMDARSQAKQMMASGLQIPGFRKDERVLERLLNRYIWPLTIMGAIAVGFLAAFADVAGALSRGTGILLTVMIVYKLYEEIAQQHMMDMYPAMRRFIGG